MQWGGVAQGHSPWKKTPESLAPGVLPGTSSLLLSLELFTLWSHRNLPCHCTSPLPPSRSHTGTPSALLRVTLGKLVSSQPPVPHPDSARDHGSLDGSRGLWAHLREAFQASFRHLH